MPVIGKSIFVRVGVVVVVVLAMLAFWFGRMAPATVSSLRADPEASPAKTSSVLEGTRTEAPPENGRRHLGRDEARTVEFHETVPVEAISSEYPRAFNVALTIEPPTGSALDALHRFETAAKQGDVHAGYMMYQSIERCQEARLASQMRELEKSKNNVVEYQRLLARNETTLQECEGVGPKEIALGYEGLQTAAERGDVVAQLHYPAIAYDEFPTTTDMIRSAEKLVQFRENAVRYMTSAAGRGSIQAMRMLAGAYKGGVFAKPDLARSYMYTFSAYLLKPGPATQSFVDDAAGNLTPEQIDAAQQQARQLLDRCCRQ